MLRQFGVLGAICALVVCLFSATAVHAEMIDVYDTDSDGDVDTADVTSLIGNWTGAGMAGNLTDTEFADLIYHPGTGNVSLDASDTASGVILSFVLATEDHLVHPMRPEGFDMPFFDVGTNTDAQMFQIGQTDPLNFGADVADLGDIFPLGMDQLGLQDYLSQARYASTLGGGTPDFDLRVVPEPGTLAMLAIGALAGLLFWRRRAA